MCSLPRSVHHGLTGVAWHADSSPSPDMSVHPSHLGGGSQGGPSYKRPNTHPHPPASRHRPDPFPPRHSQGDLTGLLLPSHLHLNAPIAALQHAMLSRGGLAPSPGGLSLPGLPHYPPMHGGTPPPPSNTLQVRLLPPCLIHHPTPQLARHKE
jgi:hypothetical protein